MSITLDEKIVAIWYVKLGDDLDVMIALSRCEAGFKVEGRTRLYLGDPEDPWDDKDRKRWFEGGVKATADTEAIIEAREKMVEMAGGFVATFRPDDPPVIHELLRGKATVEKFAEMLQAMPWAHSKKEAVH